MIGKRFRPLLFIFANDNYTLRSVCNRNIMELSWKERLNSGSPWRRLWSISAGRPNMEPGTKTLRFITLSLARWNYPEIEPDLSGAAPAESYSICAVD